MCSCDSGCGIVWDQMTVVAHGTVWSQVVVCAGAKCCCVWLSVVLSGSRTYYLLGTEIVKKTYYLPGEFFSVADSDFNKCQINKQRINHTNTT